MTKEFKYNNFTVKRVDDNSSIIMTIDTDGTINSTLEPAKANRAAQFARQRASHQRVIDRIDAMEAFLAHEDKERDRATRTH